MERFDNDRLPEERGDLQPPRRRPPTAVGTMTPPPPRKPPCGQPHRVNWRRVAIALLVFASPLLAGVPGWLLIRGDQGRGWTVLGWTLIALACGAAGLLLWIAGVLPIRDHLRTRAADRLSHAR